MNVSVDETIPLVVVAAKDVGVIAVVVNVGGGSVIEDVGVIISLLVVAANSVDKISDDSNVSGGERRERTLGGIGIYSQGLRRTPLCRRSGTGNPSVYGAFRHDTPTL